MRRRVVPLVPVARLGAAVAGLSAAAGVSLPVRSANGAVCWGTMAGRLGAAREGALAGNSLVGLTALLVGLAAFGRGTSSSTGGWAGAMRGAAGGMADTALDLEPRFNPVLAGLGWDS